jgi:hypothetical protein
MLPPPAYSAAGIGLSLPRSFSHGLLPAASKSASEISHSARRESRLGGDELTVSFRQAIALCRGVAPWQSTRP